MGLTLAKALSKLTKSERIEESNYKSLWEIPAKDIDGVLHERIGDLAPNVKALLIINVASK